MTSEFLLSSRGMITPAKILAQSLSRYSQHIALQMGQLTVTYAELDSLSHQLALGLQNHGLKAGDHVGLFLKNSVEYMVAHLALIRIGAVCVPMNKMLSRTDVAYIAEHAGLVFLIADGHDISSLLELTGLKLVAVGDSKPGFDARVLRWRELLDSCAHNNDVPLDIFSCDEPGLLMYTGGTTGRPKGVLHTQGALGLNLLAHIISLEVRHGTRMLLSSPLAHSAGFLALACLAQGGTVVLTEAFDPGQLVDIIQSQQINMLFLVPTMIYRLLDQLDATPAKLSSLETIIYGAAPIDPGRLQQALGTLGPVFLQIYAQTECPNIATTLSKDDHLNAYLQRSCGQATLSTEVRVVDTQTGEAASCGEVGEVQLRSPFTMREYYQDPDKTRQTYQQEWLKTGDIGYLIESGHLFLVDREKDMIISGGLNVYSTEVEAGIAAHKDVRDVAVIGIPDPDWGEVVHAVIVPSEERVPELAELKAFCRNDLAAYKIPKSISVVQSLPLTPYGKIDKKALRAKFWDETDRAIN